MGLTVKDTEDWYRKPRGREKLGIRYFCNPYCCNATLNASVLEWNDVWIRIIGCYPRNIPVLVLDRPTVLLKEVYGQ